MIYQCWQVRSNRFVDICPASHASTLLTANWKAIIKMLINFFSLEIETDKEGDAVFIKQDDKEIVISKLQIDMLVKALLLCKSEFN